MAMLIARRVDSSQLSTVAISQQANLAVIAGREIKGGFFRTDADGPATLPISTDVQVLKPVGRSNAPGDLDLLQPRRDAF
jgi:hypothetical protein